MSLVDDLAHNISLRVPGFAAHWANQRSRGDLRSRPTTICGLFDSLASYLLHAFPDLGSFDSEPLWEWIGWQIESSNEELSNDVVVCFLEAIYDTEIERRCRSKMPSIVQQSIDTIACRRPRKRRWFER
jgi:hypothetical protein